MVFDRGKLEGVLEMERKKIPYAPALSSALHMVTVYEESLDAEQVGDITIFSRPGSEKVPVVLGIDGGSTTTKILLARAGTLEPVAESCVSTHGRPLEAIQGIFRQLRDVLGDRIEIKSVAYTGSSGAFYHRLFSAQSTNGSPLDLVVDEITCHALGVKRYRDDVDTICELGGQDAKFTVFDGGNVRYSKMNLSCMAGTGQTMENMMRMVGIGGYSEFERLALSAERTPVVDDTCGVFTEAGIARLASLGLPKDELAAGIVYACIGGYVHKFIGNEKFGNCISAQGGPFNSKACLAALALHTGLKINAFPHRQLFGAYGAAIAANNALNGELDG